MIRPMPYNHGIGFVSDRPIDAMESSGYRYEQVGRFHNYHATPGRWVYPLLTHLPPQVTIDGFSPNLNKELHVGHLRNLALGNSLSKIFGRNARMVALLGASLGVKKKALDGWKYWTGLLEYTPEVFYDVALPGDVIETRLPTKEEMDDGTINLGAGLPQVWDGPHGPVPVVRADGRPLYAYHDLVFAKEVAPNYYVTGQEQREHFKALGLDKNHLPMGLVLGPDGKKLKSRDGTALPAVEALGLVEANLNDTANKTELAWNILAWNFLHVTRTQDVKFEVEKWTRPEAPGMHITYTHARIAKASGSSDLVADLYMKGVEGQRFLDASQLDIELLGMASQHRYYINQATTKMDPAPVANYAHDLARKLGTAYHLERIQGGRETFREAVLYANVVLAECMKRLGMFPLTEV